MNPLKWYRYTDDIFGDHDEVREFVCILNTFVNGLVFTLTLLIY